MSTIWGPIGRTVYARTYSRRRPDGTHEDWPDTVERVVNGNCDLVPAEFIQDGERERLTELIGSMALLPAGRHLWQAGTDSLHTFNCHHTGWGQRLRDHVGFLMSVSMCGGGSGSDYSNSLISALPSPAGKVECRFAAPTHADAGEFAHRLGSPLPPDGAVYRVPDDRQGWCEALCRLTDLAEDGGGIITFDVTDVRPRGSLIRGFGGTASGPGPLIEMLVDVADVLNQCVGRSFTSGDLMAIDHAIASCVIAGNVRRSALMSVKSWRDSDVLDFIGCKQDPMAHWTTNISVIVDRDFFNALEAGDPQANVVYEALIDGMLANGEPGIVNYTIASEGESGDLCPNPCQEIFLEPFEPCCLGHINLAHFGNDFQGAAEAARLMARFLVRATHSPVEDPRQREVLERNRRIGVGILGYQEWGLAHGYKYSQIHKSEIMGAKLSVIGYQAKKAAREYAAMLSIPAPIKTTCVAPTGTISALPGVTAGIHPIFSRHFVRRIRFAADDPLVQDHIDQGHHVEDDIYSANTVVVSIPCADPILDEYDENLIEQADEISLADLLGTAAFVQRCYADNSVSFTANISPDLSRSHLAAAVLHYAPLVKGLTVFPDVSRPQSPYERISKTAYEMAAGAEIGQAMDACSTGACPVR